METKLLVVLELVCLTVAQGQKKVCFAPVACSAGDVTSTEWKKIESKSQCTDRHSEGTVPTQASITESQIQTLITEFVAKFRSELTNLLASKFDSNELKRLRNDVKEMNRTINLSSSSISERIEDQKRAICPLRSGIFYQNKCYWFKLYDRKNLTLPQAQEICSSKGGELGDILDDEHFVMIGKKARAEMKTSFADLWTGMTIYPPNKQVYLANGQEGNFTKWISPVDPLPEKNRTKIPVTYEKDESGRKGIWNVNGSYPIHGALCQDKPLDIP